MKTLTIVVDGTTHTMDADGRNLLAACLSLGYDLPYFCWHPALHAVGACRQCAVKLYRDAQDTRGRIVMSCMTPVAEGMRVSVNDPEARAFRAGVVELLMVNHPHDCPICDEGGECHLQDMTVMTGHTRRRYRFTKRTHRNQDLGPFVAHEMNRCIQCYRCVRFYRDYAGGRDLEAQGWHDNVYFGRSSDGPLESPFSGNLVEVCPTGVFTDKSQKEHYSRKWDLRTAPSVCPHCSVGCATIPGERYGSLRRVRSRYSREVNGYFLCDRGRYGYEFVNAPTRLRQPLARSDGALAPASRDQTLARAAALLGRGPVVGIGSPRASLESNYALRDLVGADRFFLAVPDAELDLHRLMESILRAGPAPAASVRDAREADAVLVLGEDVANTAPILALALRQAAHNEPFARAMAAKKIARWDDGALRRATQGRRGPLFVATPAPTELDRVAAASWRIAPGDVARLGNAVAHALDPAAPEPGGLSAEERERASRIASALKQAERPLVVSGPGLGSAALLRAAANVAQALVAAGRAARISLAFPEAGSLGAAMLAKGGLESAARAVRGADVAAVVVAEADLYRAADPETAAALAEGVPLIAIDHTSTRTTERAELVMPAATFAEGSGTLISSEGRAQRFFAVFAPPAPIQETWRWAADLAVAAGRPRRWSALDEILACMAADVPTLAAAREAAPDASFRILGRRIARQSLRATGRSSEHAALSVREPRPPADVDGPFSYSTEGAQSGAPGAAIPRFWAPGWNSDQCIGRFQIEVGGALRGGDPGVRMIEPAPGASAPYHPADPPASPPPPGSFLVIAAHHVLGSEELSSLSPRIASRAPAPYLAVSASELARLGIRAGEVATLALDSGGTLRLRALARELPAGVAALPVGAAGLAGTTLPQRGRITGGAQ